MKQRSLSTLVLASMLLNTASPAFGADHNDPNQINAIYSTKDASGFHKTKESAADIYDIFGWPADDNKGDDERVILALTFAAVPKAGELDPDLLYRIRMYPATRSTLPVPGNGAREFFKYLAATGRKFATFKDAEVRATVDRDGNAKLSFLRFPGTPDFTRIIRTNQNEEVVTPDGQKIKAFVGGRDDAFFNDLPGFFRSINYAPQFYHVSLPGISSKAETELRELPIPKTMLELEGNDLFNFRDSEPALGMTGAPIARGDDIKRDLPTAGREFKPTRYKTVNGKYRLVYTGDDAQAGKNINAVILEIPLKFITKKPQKDRIVNVWSESWVVKAEAKANRPVAKSKNFFETLWAAIESPFASKATRTVANDVEDLANFRLVDTDGQAFADAALNERWDERQKGANNFLIAPHYPLRLAHLGWGFAPSIVALGLPVAFDFPLSKECKREPKCLAEKYPLPQLVEYTDRLTGNDKLHLLPKALNEVKHAFFQELRMPDDGWRKNKNVKIPFRRTFEVFVPNVNSIDMDTTGTWPYGRRPEDQVATRFLALFLDMNAKIGNTPINIETLNQPALWYSAVAPHPVTGKPIEGPNPLKNDKEFLNKFPYLADPWPETGYYPR